MGGGGRLEWKKKENTQKGMEDQNKPDILLIFSNHFKIEPSSLLVNLKSNSAILYNKGDNLLTSAFPPNKSMY